MNMKHFHVQYMKGCMYICMYSVHLCVYTSMYIDNRRMHAMHIDTLIYLKHMYKYMNACEVCMYVMYVVGHAEACMKHTDDTCLLTMHV